MYEYQKDIPSLRKNAGISEQDEPVKTNSNDRMKEVNPRETTRAYAFEMWMDAPMPTVTFFKTIDVTRLVRISKRTGLKFNMLMCWCIGRAAKIRKMIDK